MKYVRIKDILIGAAIVLLPNILGGSTLPKVSRFYKPTICTETDYTVFYNKYCDPVMDTIYTNIRLAVEDLPTAYKEERIDYLFAQAMLESRYGKSILKTECNNIYGIKAWSNTTPHKVYYTKEFMDGQWVKLPFRFKKYSSLYACVQDRLWLKEKGYATDPNYKSKIYNILKKLKQCGKN